MGKLEAAGSEHGGLAVGEVTSLYRIEYAKKPEAKGRCPAWEKLVYYLYLLIYHRRGTREAERLSARIEEKVGRRRRKAVQTMVKTHAEYLLEEGKKAGIDEGIKKGRIEGWQTMLLAQLSEKFGAVPRI